MHKFKTMAAAAALVVGLAVSAGAQATTLFNYVGPTADTPTDSGYTTGSFNAAAGAASLVFTLDGYASLDGQNYYEDDFSLYVNNTQIVSATFNLGGGGNDVVYFAPGGSIINNISGNGTNVTWAGGQVLFNVPINLVAGNSNHIEWYYNSLPGPTYAGFQGLGDEGWGLEQITVSQGVPEPMTWSLMILGFGAAGAMLRRSRQLTLA
jgi:hypothetical protein